MDITNNLKRAICSLFEVHADDNGVQRVVTPLEYPGSNDKVIVRIRPSHDGTFTIDENGEAAFYASLIGGDLESDAVGRWAEDLSLNSPVVFSEDEILSVTANNELLIAPSIFRVAEAAQQLFAISTSKADRNESDFKDRVRDVVASIALEMNIEYKSDVELPIAGGLKADHVIGDANPLIIIAATSSTRLLEAEVIYMQYRADHKPGKILAVAESQSSVGKKQFERAGYYTNRSVIFNSDAFGKLICDEAGLNIH